MSKQLIAEYFLGNGQTLRVLTEYSEDEPRDDQGRWIDSGSEALPKVTYKQAADSWFEYDNASIMKDYSAGKSIENARGGQNEELSKEEINQLKSKANLLQREASTKYSGHQILFRGASISDKDLEKYSPGKVITNKGLTSSSPDQKLASIYSDEQYGQPGNRRTIFKIQSSDSRGIKGTRATPGEVILPHGGRYKVIDRKDSGDDTIITMKEILPNRK